MRKKAIISILLIIFAMIAFYTLLRSPTSPEKEASNLPIEPEFTKIEPMSSNLSIQIPNTSQKPVPDLAEENAEELKEKTYDQMKRAQFLEQIAPILQERLSNEGFTQHEIDQTSKELAIEFSKNNGPIMYSEAAYRAAKFLNFSEDKKDQLNIAVLKSIAQSVDIPFDRWNQCLNYRVKSMPQCVQEIAQDLSRSVAATTSGQSLVGEERGIVVDLSKKAMTDAVNRCGISMDQATRAFRIVLSDCP
ncbi:MAG TPA: hypothetical protein V6C65_00270 [Allocoleopsis sp.]